jgi:branched-chain amino acid transport system substrate-binding protein
LRDEYNTGTVDFRTIITKIKTLDIDAVYIATQTPQDAGILIKQMNDFGLLERVKILGNPTVIDTKTSEVAGNLLPKDAFTIVPYVENNELLEKYLKKYNKKPGFQFFYTASAYDMVYMLKDAIEVCGENSACVKDYFYQNNLVGSVST